MRELFIYYQSTLENERVLHAEVLALQADLQTQHPGLQTRLLRRAEASDGMNTWMEIYAVPMLPEGVSDDLQREIEAAAKARLSLLITGPRHIESFVTCA